MVGAFPRGKNADGITPCNVEQAVCAVHTPPYLGVGVKQAVSLVGEGLCEACKQSNETTGSNDVT